MAEEYFGGGGGGGGVLNIAGGSNITISSSGGSITINGGVNTGATTFLAGVGSLGNTLGTTGLVNLQNYFVGGTNVTLSQSTNGQSATITIIGPPPGTSQSVQPEGTVIFGVSSGGNTLGTTGMASGTGPRFVLVGGSNVTLSQSLDAGGSSATITIIGAAGGSGGGIAASIGGNSTSAGAGYSNVTSGTIVLAGGNNVTLSQNGASVTIVGPTGGGAGMGTGANTSGTSGTVGGQLYFYAGSNISLSQSVNGVSGSLTINGASGGTGGAGMKVGVTSLGNTSGQTGTFSNQVVFAGGNNITLSGATNSDGVTYTISAPAGGGIGVSTDGNSLGTTGTVDVRYVLVGGNNITLSQSIDAGGSSGTVTIFGPDTFHHPDITLAGNSTSAGAGFIEISSGVMTLAGGSNITLSQDGNAVTVIGASGGAGGGGTLSQWMPPGLGYSSFTQQGQSSLVMFPAPLQANLSVSRADVFASVNVVAATNSGTLSLGLGVYTRNVSTLSLASSGSISYTWNIAGTASTASLLGLRNLSVPLNAVMTPGDYWLGFLSQTSNSSGAGITISNLELAGFASAYNGSFWSATNASNQLEPGLGVFSAQTAALPASVAFGDLIASSASTARPVVNLLNFTA